MTKQYKIEIDTALFNKLKEFGRKDRRPIKYVIEIAIERHLIANGALKEGELDELRAPNGDDIAEAA